MIYLTHKINSHTLLRIAACRLVAGLIGCFLGVSSLPALAQLCSELPTQPVIYETFGSGSQRPSLTGQTTYGYQNGNCPEDGQYAITSFIDGTCFDSVWHAIPQDHTPGDSQGNMLLVNGGYDGGIFFQQPVLGLCPATTYEFSFWAVNLIKPGRCGTSIVPVLGARIETETGELLQTLDLGSVPVVATPTWTRYAGTFTAPDPVNQLVISLTNQKGGCGNDFAIDDIQVRQCSLCAPTAIYVPDAFTPNNDGINDEFEVVLRELSAFDLKIYNRWGSLIFTSNSLSQKWNGTYANAPCPVGDYTWTISYKSVNQAGASAEQVRTGHVLLLR